MAISLTGAGLYLEPRVYVGTASGNNYGVPRVYKGSSLSGLSGSWTGISIGTMGAVTLHEGVSTVTGNSLMGGGFSSEYPNLESKGGSINGYILKFKRIKSKLSDFNKNCKSRLGKPYSQSCSTSRMFYLLTDYRGKLLSNTWRHLFKFLRKWKLHYQIGNEFIWETSQSGITPFLLKEVA